MGIHYYASALEPFEIADARPNPRAFALRDEPCTRNGCRACREIDTLYLDKAHRLIAAVLSELREGRPSPASLMFAGRVENTCVGWKSYHGVLDIDEVRSAEQDLASITADDVRRVLGNDGPRPGDAEYATSYLQEARAFLKRLAAKGNGMLYTIG